MMHSSSETAAAPANPAIGVTGVDFVMIPVQDLAAARAFYGGILGLAAGKLWQRDGHPAIGAEFQAGNLTLALMTPAAIGGEFRTGAGAIALHVPDVAAAREQLQAQGVQFAMEELDSGACHQAIFADPDGNTLILHHRYRPHDAADAA